MVRVSIRLAIIAATAVLILGLPAGASAAAAPTTAKALRQIPTWSYVGPRGPLVGATVVVRDRTGRELARCTSGSNGTCTVDLQRVSGVRLPLTVDTSGGRILGARFRGHLRARAFDVTTNGGIVQLSVISTAASHLAADRRGYDRSVLRVRRALGIPRSAPSDVLRLRNGHVGFRQLASAVVRAGGFDAFAADLAKIAERGARVQRLRPASAATSGAVRVRVVRGQARATTRASSTPTCAYPIASPTSSSPTQSSEVIADVAQVGSAILLDSVGMPEADMIVGMALAPLGQQQNPYAAQLNQINNDLQCISEQLNFLTTAIADVQLSIDISAATNCSSALGGSNAFQGYEYMIANASAYPITSSNKTLKYVYLPAWNSAVNTCGSAIDDMLFGTSGGQKSAWQQLVANTLGTGKWYTQPQVQALQSFLSYWATMEYEQFILGNEYDNYLGAFEAAQSSAGVAVTTANGAVAVQTDASGKALCTAGSTSATHTFCVWTNSIVQAYPGDLLSDEIGTVTTGYAVNAIPGGMVAPVPIATSPPSGSAAAGGTGVLTSADATGSGSAMAMNPRWAWNYYLNFTSTNKSGNSGETNDLTMYYAGGGAPGCNTTNVKPCVVSGQSVATFDANVVSWFAGLGVNPNGYGSAIQTYQNPQITQRQIANWSDVSDLGSGGAGGQSATSVLLAAVNQTPGGGTAAWSGLTASEVLYMTGDTGSYVEALYSGDPCTPLVVGDYATISWQASLGAVGKTKCAGLGSIPATPVFAFLTKRSWWLGAATAATYARPAPTTA